jgi:hypothetical protein
MRIVELISKIQIPITNEESELLEQFTTGSHIAKSKLSDREQMIANQLTVKDILTRFNEDGKIYYKKQIS